LKTSLLHLLSRVRSAAFRYLEKHLEEAGLSEISVAHGDVLFVVARAKALEVQEIAAALGKDKSTVSSIVSQLEAHGYLARARDPGDARRAIIRLTPLARRITPRMLAISRGFNARLLAGISRQERKFLEELLRRMDTNLAELE
jgi:DNA-binding MarR family transcriptional regulator